MRDKGQLTIVEMLAGFIIAVVIFIVFISVLKASVINGETTPEYEMERCMDKYEDFDYCKYKLGVK